MRKRIGILALSLLCLLALASCGKSGGEEGAYTKEQAQAILDGGVFSEELEELDLDTAFILYGFQDAGMSREDLTGGMVYRSAGATCEELAYLEFAGEDQAKQAADTLKTYLDGQIADNQDYRPAEIPKLEDPVLGSKGSTVLLVVSGNNDKVEEIVAK